MARLELLDPHSHRHVRVQNRPDAKLSDARHFVPVIVSEFSKLAVHYPILLTKASNTGAFFVGAMLGIAAGENLFLKPSGGQDSYQPLEIRRGPFFVSGDDLAIDMESPRISEIEGDPLFEPDLSPTPYLRGVQATITQLKYGLDETEMFVRQLLSMQLIEPIDISLRFDDGTRHHLEGLYTVSSDRLHALSDTQVLDLFRRGYLRLAYAMIGSLDHIPVLAKLRNDRLAEGL
jgi:hypothetical protein